MNCSNNKYENVASSYGKCSNNNANNNRMNSSPHNQKSFGLEGYPLANVYAPIQEFVSIYDIDKALIRGTIFGELDLPFVCGGMTGGNG